jgi:heme/copper-type cytochrome/quinol oxidase subunit 3
VPRLLWFNTGVLVLSSVALQWAQVAARRNDMDGVIVGLCAGREHPPLPSWSASSWRGNS